MIGSHQWSVSVVQEDNKHPNSDRSTRQGGRCQGDSHGFVEGEELQLTKDAGCLLAVRPQLLRTALTLEGT